MDNPYFVHNIYMAEIGDCIVNDKVPLTEKSKVIFSNDATYQSGVREIIGLYLLIPYLNSEKNQLKYDIGHKQISIYDDEECAFYDTMGNPVLIRDLRDTLCHSFVSCELRSETESLIVFDDRAIIDKKVHSELANTENGTRCILVNAEDVLLFLRKSYSRILQIGDEQGLRKHS